MQKRHLKTCWRDRISQVMEYKKNDISDLIPDYCNNRLDANERADFESLFKEDPELFDECNDFQGFQKLYRQIDPAEPSPSDAIFNQISSRVSAQQKVERKERVKPRMLVESIRNYWLHICEYVTVPWMLAGAQAVVIVLLLMPATQQNTYSTLSATKETASVEKNTINIVFRPNALESDIRSLLHTIEGSVSSGPSREGRYVISIGNQNELDKVMRTLKQSEIVLFAALIY